MLGLVTLDTTLFGPVAALYGIERAAHEAGYYVSVVSLRSIDRQSVSEAVQRLQEQAVAGVIVIAPLTSAKAALGEVPRDLPVVVIEGDPRSDLAAVTIDQRAGARATTEYLLSLGHRTVFHVSGPRGLDGGPRADRRLALGAQGRGGTTVPDVFVGDWTARSGFAAGCRLAELGEVTAVFVANDHMALGVLRALHENGRRVPGDVSVVGFDDIAEAEYFSPSLTTVHQDFDEVGRRSLELVVHQLGSGQRSLERVVLSPRLVVRHSAAPPPG